MNSYLIIYIKNKIEVSEYIDNKRLEKLRYRAEIKQNYDETEFWKWFKKKIDYDNEELSFIVITDEKDFNIPQNSKITISEVNKISQNQDIIDISKGYFILSFPKRDKIENSSEVMASTSPYNEVKTIDEAKTVVSDNNKSNSLVNAFRKQTEGYKNDKR